MQDTCSATDDRGGMFTGRDTASTRLHSAKPYADVGDECAEDADRVRAPADAGDDDVRQLAEEGLALRSRLAPDHRLEVADHRRVRVRPDRRAEEVVRRAH